VEQVRVFIADADPDERADIISAMEAAGAEVAGAADTDEDALARIISTDPDVVIIRIATTEQAVDLCRRMLDARPGIRCLVLATATEEEAFLQAVLVGAAGIVRRDRVAATLLGAAPGLHDLAVALLDRHGARDTERLLAELTPLQRDVALRVMSGATNSEIASELHLSLHTVRNYISRIMLRFGARNRTELAVELATILLRVSAPPDGAASTPRRSRRQRRSEK
jgi:two-component system response regulator DevR